VNRREAVLFPPLRKARSTRVFPGSPTRCFTGCI